MLLLVLIARSTLGCRRRALPAGIAALAAACGGPSPGGAAWTAAGWSPPVVLPAAPGGLSGNDHRVTDLAAGPDGTLHALVADDADGDGLTDRLLHGALARGAWTPLHPVGAAPGRKESARLVVDGSGGVHALWYEGRTPEEPHRLDALVHASLVDGRWSAPAPVYEPGGDPGIPGRSLAATTDAQGRVHVVHLDREGRLVEVVREGMGWSAPRPAGRDGADLRMAAGPDGALAVAGVTEFLHFAQSTSFGDIGIRFLHGGGWSEPVPVHATPRDHSHQPQVAWDRRGVLHAVWLEGEGGEMLPRRLLHAASANGRVWTPAEHVAGGGGGPVLYSPRLAVDGRGLLHLTFARFRLGLSDPRHFHAVWDGARWSRPAEILPALGARDSELETVVDREGRLHAVWKGADGSYRHAMLREPA